MSDDFKHASTVSKLDISLVLDLIVQPKAIRAALFWIRCSFCCRAWRVSDSASLPAVPLPAQRSPLSAFAQCRGSSSTAAVPQFPQDLMPAWAPREGPGPNQTELVLAPVRTEVISLHLRWWTTLESDTVYSLTCGTGASFWSVALWEECLTSAVSLSLCCFPLFKMSHFISNLITSHLIVTPAFSTPDSDPGDVTESVEDWGLVTHRARSRLSCLCKYSNWLIALSYLF